MFTPYLLLIPLLILFAYVAFHQRKLVQQATAISLEQAKTIKKLEQDISQRDSDLSTLNSEKADSETKIAELLKKLDDLSPYQTLFRTFSDVAYDMLFILNEDTTIAAMSETARSFFEDDNPIGKHLCDVINAPDLSDLISRAVDELEGLEEQFIFNQKHFRARAQTEQLENGDKLIGVALLEITQLVRLNRARRDMVANISHELGTPVANIRLIIDSLFHDQTRPKRKASIASLRAIARETETLQWTVQELLDLSMIESGQAIMKLVEEPLHEIVDAAIERLEEKLDRKNIDVVRHIPVKLRVLCDRDHIRRVLVNLISNAIKYSPTDEAITISATKNGDVTISVFDNGPGVPDEQRERIFERFYQVDTARSGREGSGLGLAICKHIVVAHGGKIWAEGNSQGGGGRFLFTLLNDTKDTDEDSYMDRGQHDVVLNPYVRASQNQAVDEGEIEFVEESELDD